MSNKIKLNFHNIICHKDKLHSLPIKLESEDKAKVEVYSYPCIDESKNGMLAIFSGYCRLMETTRF